MSADRLRIVQVIDRVSGGGAEKAVVELAARQALEHDVTVVGSRETEDSPAVAALRERGVRVLPLDRGPMRNAWEWTPAVREIRRRRTDVVHTHLYGSNAWGPLLKGLGGARILVAHEHTPVLRSGGIREGGFEAAVNPYIVAPFADRVICPSSWSRDALVAHERVPADKIRVIANGAPTMPRPTDAERTATRASLGLAPDDHAIVISAMLRPEKGHDTALRALQLLLRDHPRARLVVVGAGPDGDARTGTRSELDRLADELGVTDAVLWLGRREDVPAVLCACDVALLASDLENFPVALLEYMASGVPIVATAVGGVPDAIPEGTALQVPPRDPALMAAALGAVLADPDAARDRAARATARHAEYYTWEAVTRTVEHVYRETLPPRR
ncbi:glycosyltransferase [Patulibacter minatonensis]|uniref:glycosyltransferase n=1 Tax=Patulibacter minatonensis TaxID=298163 RepID=UPI00047B2749|nr:glycosyltransferase [Patulibacter minatonensis]